MSEFKPRKNMLYKEIHVDNFREMIDYTANTYKDRIAFSYKKDKTSKNPEYINISYKKHKEDIEAFSTKLLELGLEGKRIAIISHNKYQWPLSYMAINNGNMVVVPLDYMLPENEIESLIKRSEAGAVIFENKYESIFKKIKQSKESNLKYLINMDLEKSSEEVYSFYELLKEGYELLKEGNTIYKNIKIDNDKMSIMLFTSGTTGVSKAVELSQKNICSNVSAMTTLIKMNDKDSVLSFLPLHHVFECTVGFLYPISIGGSIAFCEGVKHMAENIKEFEITAMISVPAVFDIIYRKVMKTIEKKGKLANLEKGKKVSQFLLKMKIDLRKQLFKEVHESLGPKLKLVVTGGAALDPETEKGFNDLGFDVEQGYGLTETAPVIAAETPKCRRLGSIGKKFPSVEVKIDDPDEEGIGELMAKGPSIMLGYYENEEATKSALESDGWFHTGDLARIDKDGFIYISGRKKSVIVLNNGKNVFPEEIETLLNKVEGIKETFVFEKKEDDGDVKVCVEIVYDKELIKELYNIEGEENIKEFLWDKVKEVNKLMPKYKYVREMVITEEPLIKTTTLKIKRHEELKKVLGK